MGSIYPNRYQPRKHFDEEALAELRDSIRTHGVLQPIALRKDGDRFELIAGERRWRAATEAGLARIPAVVRESVTDAAMLELALVENVQREDLDPIERALGYQQMVDELSLTQAAVAERVGLKRATVTNHLRLLDLAEPIQRLVARGALSMGHARALLGLADSSERSRLADLVISQGLSVREVEARVRRLNGVEEPSEEPSQVEDEKVKTSSKTATQDEAQPTWVRPVEDRLRKALGTRVQLKLTDGEAGQVVIDFSNAKDLDRLIEALSPAAEI
ncbi:MAG: ParB/RepB/Spo0J family partition protein [Planctomycetota bacterium]